jgi:hypothetical protein
MKVLIPCAGKSSRYPNMRPKWMLEHPDGNLMIKKSIEGLKTRPEDIIVTILREHEEKYNITKGLKEHMGEGITVILLDEQTKSQAETVYLTLKKADVTESFIIKDSDNIFSTAELNEDFNYACFSDIGQYEDINAADKSYLKMDDQNKIIDMAEKQIISTTFSVGGYYFKDPKDFMTSFEKLSKSREDGKEIYPSHIISDMIVNEGKTFFGKEVHTYSDWGTFEKWAKYCKNFKTYFLDVDGILFKDASQFFKPYWKDAQPTEENLKILKELSEDKNAQLFFITSRPESYRQLTEDKFRELGIEHDGLVMGCFNAKKILISDFIKTVGHPSCEAVTILRNSEDLKKYI